ncbi:arsenate reductase (glutaredoxin) [Streptococcus iniae]|uniref:arsenate reductase (glutaredoxin) n=1 Tax=Streptococcus iniae TaxID=1346 RepID=UPI000EF74332|nr:arsenate reductase (glutaredoxin) [Streptococcus iniae]RLU28837.1 arsenate reductase (glutaredoxin) [Streptococcus iniae]RLU32077.1 arsenate reductase (glutaredoxin) [Streptococcus iniae]RLV34026.1 arsenate reductase (glutaredoxin) [Streptococcus iniae]
MEEITIYHNPNCGTSRNVLAMIRHAGIEPKVIEYLIDPPTRQELVQLISDCGLTAKQVLRSNVAEYEKHALGRDDVSQEELVDAMMQDPILINRPIVVTSRGTRLCRPSEEVLQILPVPFPSPFVKENGQVIYAR